MKLKTLKTYQSVRFNLKDETHFDVRIPRFENIQMEYDVKLQVIRIEIPGKDSVLVFQTNVAYAALADSEVVELKEVKEAKKIKA